MIERVACLFLVILVGRVLATPPENPKHNPEPWQTGPPADPSKPNTWNFAKRITGGFVQAADKGGITLYRPELEVRYFRHDPLTGQLLEEKKKEIHAAWPAKKFLLVEELAKESYLKSAAPEFTYRISDVQVGDWIGIEYCRLNGVDICQTISIKRRPCGQVPPAPGEKPNAFFKHHERMNADQDWEEKRVAYPEKYRPNYLGPDGKFYVGRYPSESIQIIPILAVAPAPREVKQNSPSTKP
jgi:hypothetical protein